MPSKGSDPFCHGLVVALLAVDWLEKESTR